MRKLLMVLVLCGFTSCSLFESTEKKTQKLVEKELLEIDWTDVDDYPLFSDCDELLSKEIQKQCFEEKLLLHLSADLQEFQLTSETEIKDVVFLDFRIENDGAITIINIENKEIFGSQMEKFEDKVAKSLKSLPRIEPALKRGIPVSAKFRIPIFLNSK
ncbi:hypothetical protein FEE95_02780 [Maribacter algarum]|uniref:TonB C-terminal domain-containing protein n=1 Tax=Maribacter algarum (ex Zhang et al. 2020) TaxID=2578118 RepID=A0A5S3PTS4_9FLAO|nr:hypothetical protein [Maribacter algarum]TMM58373.1 hypothetical protein FEE95_02780 [Maribacter algarum]